MTDTVTPTKAKRTTPVALGEHEGELPKQSRDGFWKDQFKNTFQPNPGKVYKFGSVSASTASNLRKDYGLNATTNTVNGETTLYVQWVPERAEEIMRDVAERGAKRKATMQANKAKNATKSSR